MKNQVIMQGCYVKLKKDEFFVPNMDYNQFYKVTEIWSFNGEAQLIVNIDGCELPFFSKDVIEVIERNKVKEILKSD